MKVRSKPEALVLRSSVALMWLGGRTHAEIAQACGITRNYVGVILHALRTQDIDLPARRGDPPLGSRRKPKLAWSAPRVVPRPRTGSKPPFSNDHEDVLDAWADGMQAKDIAVMTRRSVGSVKQILYRARGRKDPRAVPHPRWPAPAVTGSFAA